MIDASRAIAGRRVCARQQGLALYRLGRNDDALAWFDRAIAILAKDDDAREALAIGLEHKGEVLWKLGHRDEARDAFAQAEKIQPANAALAETLKRLNVQARSAGATARGTSRT
ncbi:tetratricopeptide repeat protein [Burkholderia anthina]|uniref:Tetratricopeptide repeat protein n=1 Tax=Burkholderia anthina TaxID=179879 RepID=A0AAW3PWG4_9BURK|nr:tetratricopeptide repeat protein [Burkholderia anthina]KWZ33220.1 hypothetical protein WS64_19625 [Burkholderia anthina]